MRFKYYLRGIGLGIIFAVLIMIIAIHNHKDSFLSDKEIIDLTGVNKKSYYKYKRELLEDRMVMV